MGRAVSVCYNDTSALAKWYLQEAGSQAFEVFANTLRVRLISRLTTVELRCLLARRRRANEIDEGYEADAWSTFTTHIAAGYFASSLFATRGSMRRVS